MTPKTFRYELDDGIGRITLCRPKTLNSLTFDVYAELRDFFVWLEDDRESRVIILTGEGKGFCSGGDFHEIIKHLVEMNYQQQYDFSRMTCDLIRNMRRLRKPVIGQLHGATTGAGAVMAAACDIRIAAENTKIAYLFPRVGLSSADMGIAYILPRLVGLGIASELLLTGRFIYAEEAARIGLVNRVVPLEKLAEETTALARDLAKGPRIGLAVTKEALNEELFMAADVAIWAEAETQARLMQGNDFKEAYHAFLEKRDPKFTD